VGRRQGADVGGSEGPVALDEWAQYGVGEPDADGLYPDYRIPADLKPSVELPKDADATPVTVFDIVSHWDAVHLDLMERFHVNLHDPAVLASPWLGIRPLVLSLLQAPSRLTRALKE